MYNKKYSSDIIELIKKSKIKAEKMKLKIEKQKDLKKYEFKEIANFFWTGELSECEVVCIKSFVQKGFHVKLWSYENLKVDGAESCDASLVLPKTDLTKYSYKITINKPNNTGTDTKAAFSDVFRYNVIEKFGGWWFDADCYCLKSAEDFYNLRKNKSIVAGLESFVDVANGVLYMDNKTSKLVLQELKEKCYQYNYNFPKWGTIGPTLITKFIHKNKLYDGVLNNKFFYSIHIEHSDFYFKSDLNKLAKSCLTESYLTHIWHIKDLNNKKEKGSLLDEFFNNNYTNNEIQHQGLLYKQNNFYNRFIVISNLFHKILNKPPVYEDLYRYVYHNVSIEKIQQEMEQSVKILKSNKEIANFFWTGELSECEVVCIKSFVQKGFHVKLWSYENLKVDGAESCDASLVLPKTDLTKYKQKLPDYRFKLEDYNPDKQFFDTSAAFSDAFRYYVIHKFGGWWFDADCYCLKSAEDFYNLRKNKSIVTGLQSLTNIASGVFYADNRVSKLLVDELERLCNLFNYNFPEWAMIGPKLIGDVIHKNKLYDGVLNNKFFYSIHIEHSDFYFKSDLNKLAKSCLTESYLTHIWHIKDLNNKKEKGSLLDEFFNNNYTNNEIQHQGLLYKQNNFYNRFIVISNLFHKILNKFIDEKTLGEYISSEKTFEQIETELQNKNNKEIANFFWTGKLSEMEIKCIKSFVQKGFHVKLWSYENLKVDGAESCDASLVLPKTDLTKYKQKRGDSNLQETSAVFSDVFRYNVIEKFGGWWFDADCYCLKSAEDFYNLRKNKSIVAGLESLGYPYIGSATFYADNRVSKLLVDELKKTCTEYDNNFPDWGLIGPQLITKVVHNNKLYDEILLHNYFYSIDLENSNLFFKSHLNKLAKSCLTESYLTHIWHSSGLYINMEKGSLLDELINDNYFNNEMIYKDLLEKQNIFYNRFIKVSNLYHRIKNRPPNNKELIKYVPTNFTIEQIENELLKYE